METGNTLIISEAEEALDYLYEEMRVGTSEYYSLAELIILAKRLTTPAKWVKKGKYPYHFWECSNCKNYVGFILNRTDFCCNCGRPMIKEEDEQNE